MIKIGNVTWFMWHSKMRRQDGEGGKPDGNAKAK